MKKEISLQVNGKTHSVIVDPGTPLLYVLRNKLMLNGPKYGCGLEQCGSCMVLLNDKAMPSCVVPVDAVKDKKITTLEGIQKKDGTLHQIQQAFVDEQAAQCGYCVNGMVISAVSLLNENSKPDEASIKEGLQRVLCRCSAQPRVIKAIKRASENL